MSDLTQLKLKVSTAFLNIGTKNGTAPPQSGDNRFPIAYEYMIAKQLKSMAEKREELAKAEAGKAGLLGNYAPDPGNAVTVYDNEHFALVAKTANPASRIDPAKLRTELIKKLNEKQADEIIAAATVKNKAATSYTFVEK